MTIRRRNKSRLSRARPARRFTRLALAWLLAALVLAACGEDKTLPPPPANNSSALPPEATATPPFPAQPGSPAPTATSDVPRALPGSNQPALFPTNTPRPVQSRPDFTATAGLPPVNLTPTAYPSGQLAYIQAGNLWLIDDTGGNRRQLTEAADIAGDTLISWNSLRDKMVYISRSGDLYTVDLQGKRALVFSPGRTAKPVGNVKLPPDPTPPGGLPGGVTPRPGPAGGLQLSAPAWSSDGRYIAFTFYSGESGQLAGGEVWIADLLGEKVNLVRVGEGFSPSWGPDNKTLAYLSRGEAKQGAARPGPFLTPQGTPLLPPTRPGQSSGQEETGRRAANQDNNTPAPNTPANPLPSPTSFIILPGGTILNGTVTPGPTAPPTPTLNIQVLPSPTPTPTFPPVFLGSYSANRIMLYNLGTRKSTPLLDSDRLPDAFLDPNNNYRSYVPAPFQRLWFSPDGRYLAFSDRLSVVGVAPLSGGDPVIWTGQPQAFAVFDLDWLPRSDGAFIVYGNPYYDDGNRLALVTFTGNAAPNGVSGDVTNRANLKLNNLPGLKVDCNELSPGGNYYSYYDGRAIVVTRNDGSIVSSYTDVDCPSWSPFGTGFASVRKNSDRAINLTTLGQPQSRSLLSTRAVDRVFWLRVDPTLLGGQPNPVPSTQRP